MNIDRIARAMTGGTPRAGFTARVMAPIHGRPRPGFTARVMDRLDEPVAVGRSFSSGIGRALILMPAAIALAAGVSLVRASRVVVPALPDAPGPATARIEGPRVDSTLVGTRHESPARAPRRIQASPVQQATAAIPEAPPIYTIPALEGPASLTAKPMLAPAVAIPALAGPAPLKITDLPGAAGGSPSGDSKEKS